jgi:hypothetical protein
MELNGLANIKALLDINTDQITPTLKVEIEKQIDLMVVYFRTYQKNKDIAWNEVKNNIELYKKELVK